MQEDDESWDDDADPEDGVDEMVLFEALKGEAPVGTTDSTKEAWDSWLSLAGEEKPPHAITAISPPRKLEKEQPVPKELRPEEEDGTDWMLEVPEQPEVAPVKAGDASVEAAWGAFEMLDKPKVPETVEKDIQPEAEDEEEEEDVDLPDEMELLQHLKQGSQASQPAPAAPPALPGAEKAEAASTAAPTAEATGPEVGLPPGAGDAGGLLYADMEICSTASDEGMDFFQEDSSEESSEDPPVAGPKAEPKGKAKAKAKAKAAQPQKTDRKRKAAALEPILPPALKAPASTASTTPIGGIATGDKVKILKPAQGKDKLEGALATVSCEMPPSSLQLTLPDGQQVLRKRSEVSLVEKSTPATAAHTLAERMPHKSSLLRQLKTVESERAEVLRGRKLERESVSVRQPRQAKGGGKGKGTKGSKGANGMLGAMTTQMGGHGPELGSSFNQLGKVLDVQAKARGEKVAMKVPSLPPPPRPRTSPWGGRWSEPKGRR